MKFSAPVIALAAVATSSASATSIAAAVSPRDLETTLRVMTNVLNNMANLDACIAAYSGTDADNHDLAQKSVTMLSVLQSSYAEINGMIPVPLQDAQTFQPLSDKLNAQGDSLLGHVDAKIAVFGANGICLRMVAGITSIGDAVNNLMHAVSDHFPEEGRAKNSVIITHFNDIFAASIAKLQACANSYPAGSKTGGDEGADTVSAGGAASNTVAPYGSVIPGAATGTVKGAGPSSTAPAASKPTGADTPTGVSGKQPVVTAGAPAILLSGFVSGAMAVFIACLVL